MIYIWTEIYAVFSRNNLPRIKDGAYDLTNEIDQKTCRYLNYVEHLLLTLVSTVTGCVSISAFPFISCYSCRYYKFCSRNKNMQNYCRKKKEHQKIVLLGKDKLNTIEVSIDSKALIDSYISHEKFVSLDNVLREYNEMK